MAYSFVLFAFLLGTIVGSFLNVVALRYNSGVTLFGRSRCFACSVTLRWFDLVPVASFFVLRGRCRGCGSTISFQYPVVELVTGVVFALVFWQQAFFSFDVYIVYDMLRLAFWWIIFSLLIAISIYDLRHKIIPDGLVYLFVGLAFVKIIVGVFGMPAGFFNFEFPLLPDGQATSAFGALFSGPLLAAPFAALWLISRGRWMGLGDAKLALGIGWLLGLSQGLAAIVLSFWLGALVSLGVLLVQRVRLFSLRAALTMKSEIPFGPFLVAGTFLAWFFGLDVVAIVGWF